MRASERAEVFMAHKLKSRGWHLCSVQNDLHAFDLFGKSNNRRFKRITADFHDRNYTPLPEWFKKGLGLA